MAGLLRTLAKNTTNFMTSSMAMCTMGVSNKAIPSCQYSFLDMVKRSTLKELQPML